MEQALSYRCNSAPVVTATNKPLTSLILPSRKKNIQKKRDEPENQKEQNQPQKLSSLQPDYPKEQSIPNPFSNSHIPKSKPPREQQLKITWTNHQPAGSFFWLKNKTPPPFQYGNGTSLLINLYPLLQTGKGSSFVCTSLQATDRLKQPTEKEQFTN